MSNLKSLVGSVGVLVLVSAQFACGQGTVTGQPTGGVSVTIGGIEKMALSLSSPRAVLEAQSAAVSVEMTRNDSGQFIGSLLLPVGDQDVSIVLYSMVYDDQGNWGEQEVGRGSATVTVTQNQTVVATINILQTWAPDPVPELGPVVTSMSAPSEFVPFDGTLMLDIAVFEPEGDLLTYTLSDSCGGTFNPPTVETTSQQIQTAWTAPAQPGICTLTVEAQDADAITSTSTLEIAVQPASSNTGVVDVEAEFVELPEISALQVDGHIVYRSASNATLADRLVPSNTISVGVTFSREEVDTMTLSDSCGGTFVERALGRYDWTVPATTTHCVLTATATRESLQDQFSVAVMFAN